MTKRVLLCKGKAKSVFLTDNSDQLLMEFRNDTSAFDGKKIQALEGKGAVNNQINAHIMQLLEKEGVATHFIEMVSPEETLVKKLEMLPLEFVVRNAAAGSICKRLGIEKGRNFAQPIFEIFLKDDDLGDPIVNDSHIKIFNWATQDQVKKIEKITLKINNILKKIFADINISLVDYKLEFGMYQGEIILGDEFTPDGCRLWDIDTQDSLDKDRFRQDLGDVISSYHIVAERLGIALIG